MIDSNTLDLINSFLDVRYELYNSNMEITRTNEMQKLIASSILNNMILSTKIFKRNYMIGRFLEQYFSIKLSKYILASRTSISGKVTRYIHSIDSEEELINVLNTIYNILFKIKENRDIFQADIYEVIMGIKL